MPHPLRRVERARRPTGASNRSCLRRSRRNRNNTRLSVPSCNASPRDATVTSVSALRLDSERIRGLIGDRFGGSISRLAAALPLDEPPDRSTVTRWLSRMVVTFLATRSASWRSRARWTSIRRRCGRSTPRTSRRCGRKSCAPRARDGGAGCSRRWRFFRYFSDTGRGVAAAADGAPVLQPRVGRQRVRARPARRQELLPGPGRAPAPPAGDVPDGVAFCLPSRRRPAARSGSRSASCAATPSACCSSTTGPSPTRP